MKKSLKIILCTVAAYILLLVLLVTAEARAPGASIHNVWDAIWYSIITMTTVGYGDLSPVTPLGRLTGLIFAICSIGILTALIGIGLRLIAGTFLPSLRLRLGKKRPWYVFSQENEDAAALAEDLRRSDERGLFLFPSDGKKRLDGTDVVRMDADLSALLRLRGGRTEGLSLFFMGDDPWNNYQDARQCAGKGVSVYCMADVSADDPAAGLRMFSRTEAMSRSYWKEHPLRESERCIVLVGSGEPIRALLERALLINVFEPERTIEYHVFGGEEFALLHPRILREFSPGGQESDRIVLHTESWLSSPGLLERSDRIILCHDEDAENLEACEKLRAWFPTRAGIHVRLTDPVEPLISFGERSRIITAEFVMKDAINRRAATLNEIYNESSGNGVPWQDLSWFLRQSNIAVADHLPVKVRYLLRDESITEVTADESRRAYERYLAAGPKEREALFAMEHRRWMRFHWLYNWDYAPERSNKDRKHPSLVPYEELSDQEKQKDSYAWEMLGRLAVRS